MRVLELFSGIGGCAAAVRGLRGVEIVGAVDHDRRAASVYEATFRTAVQVKNLAFVSTAWLSAFEADLWWMSPPCTPHTIRGAQRDLDDPRAAAFVRVVHALAEIRPRFVALENVPWFEGSNAHRLLLEVLDRSGYHVRAVTLCPSELGIPNVRRRFYLVAGDRLADAEPRRAERTALSAYIGPFVDELEVESELQSRFGDALHVVDADDPMAVSACFTSAYGKSPVYCGSYLRQAGRLRRFAPAEIARLLGFGDPLVFAGIGLRAQYKLVGNSLCVPAVRAVLSAVPDLGEPDVDQRDNRSASTAVNTA